VNNSDKNTIAWLVLISLHIYTPFANGQARKYCGTVIYLTRKRVIRQQPPLSRPHDK
jgi:predicted N-formylglutamate amidohydrolase